MKEYRMMRRAPALALVAALAWSAAAGAADRVKIGMISTLSGPNAALGLDIRDAFNLHLKLNGGKLGGLPVDLDIVDDQFKPDVALQAASRMIERNKVDFMTGVVFSNIMLAVGKPIFDAKVLYVSANAGPSQYAGKDCNPYFFSAAWQNDTFHEATGKYVADRGFKNVYLVAPNYAAGKDALAGFKRFYKGKVADEVYTQLGQLDYSAELTQMQAAKPDAVFMFMPGGMGINFIKQFVGAGMSKNITLFAPGFAADEDILRAVGDPALGMFNASHWNHDMDNAENQRFVAAFQKEYGRLPSVFAAQGWDTALMIDTAIRGVNGRVEDREGMRKALKSATLRSVHGPYKLGANQYPIQDYYLRVVTKGANGKPTNKTVGKIFTNHSDSYVSACAMK